jgi:SCY1-like protein 2
MDRHPHSEGFGIRQYWVDIEFRTLPIFLWMFRIEMVEPLEETRTELIFATEPLLSSLEASIPGSSRFSPLVELDEIEVRLDHESTTPDTVTSVFQIQKGVLQICKGLSFLHTSAKLIHTNISPETVIINSAVSGRFFGLPFHALTFTAQGDWKISGLGLTIPLLNSEGSPSRWEFPTFDGRVPSYVQRSFDYMGITHRSLQWLAVDDFDSAGICVR